MSNTLAERVQALENQLAYATIPDPGNAGAIAVTKSGICNITSGGAGHTRTIAAPSFDGQTLCVTHTVDGGTAVITVATTVDKVANNTITLTAAGDTIAMIGVSDGGVLRWRVIGGGAAADHYSLLSTV